jgi:hypothetical protein
MKYAAQDAEGDNFLKGVNQMLKQEIDTKYEKLLSLSIADQSITFVLPI